MPDWLVLLLDNTIGSYPCDATTLRSSQIRGYLRMLVPRCENDSRQVRTKEEQLSRSKGPSASHRLPCR